MINNNTHKLDQILLKVRKLIPKKVFIFLRPIYHLLLAIIGAVLYKHPSKHIHVIAITGTKGKSSTVEYVNAVLESGGYKTALLSTIRFKIADHNIPNQYKMTMPGRFFVQKFLREAVDNHCDFAIIEMTSEGARNWRHFGIHIDTLIFTNLSPEHIESHGSFDNYLKSKLRLAKRVENSKKPFRRIIANITNKYGAHFLIYDIEKNIGFYEEETKNVEVSLPGEFNKVNAYSAYIFGKELGIKEEKILDAIRSVKKIYGRVESIDEGQNFDLYIDYAHTPDSLQKLYEAFPERNKIAVLGSCGGGRDRSRRKILGQIAAKSCYIVIVTDEDPYDDDPLEIIEEVRSGALDFINDNSNLLKVLSNDNLFVQTSRRQAIKLAINKAKKGDCVLITGKGTDPYIMRANGEKEPWSDADIAREELKLFLNKDSLNKAPLNKVSL